MPPEVIQILEAISIWLLLALVLPKTDLPDLSGRLVALAAGKRRWLYAAPQRWGQPAGQRRRLLAESLRVIELGAPIWVVARVLEERSARRRLEAKAPWAESPAALVYARAAGTIQDLELQARLSALGSPLPAEKAMPSTTSSRPALPLDWWADRSLTLQSNGDAPARARAALDELSATTAATTPVVQPQNPELLVIRTFGRLQLLQGDQDLSDRLLQKPVLAFIWLHLLARSLSRPDDRVSRGELAEELTPGLGPERQRKRLRNRLSDMLHGELPHELAERVHLDSDESLWLDLARTQVDLLHLLTSAAECMARGGLLTADQAAEASRALAEADGEFLFEWDRLENQVNGGRGGGGELVRSLRERAEGARIDLLASLAANYVARREPAHAIPLLEQALERRPDREDLARQLRASYLETGQVGRAAAVQRDYALEA